MSEKVACILAALEKPQELAFGSVLAARRYRLSLYHFRRVAALQDPRALRVKISLQGTHVTLTYNSEAHPL